MCDIPRLVSRSRPVVQGFGQWIFGWTIQKKMLDGWYILGWSRPALTSPHLTNHTRFHLQSQYVQLTLLHRDFVAEVEDVGEDIEQINMEFTNHENYDSDDSFLASESEPTVYGDSDSDSNSDNDEKKTDKKNKVQYLVPPSRSNPPPVCFFSTERFSFLTYPW